METSHTFARSSKSKQKCFFAACNWVLYRCAKLHGNNFARSKNPTSLLSLQLTALVNGFCFTHKTTQLLGRFSAVEIFIKNKDYWSDPDVRDKLFFRFSHLFKIENLCWDRRKWYCKTATQLILFLWIIYPSTSK